MEPEAEPDGDPTPHLFVWIALCICGGVVDPFLGTLRRQDVGRFPPHVNYFSL